MLTGEEGIFRNRDKDYLRAQPTETMSVPAGIEKPDFEPLYPVPNFQAYDEFGDIQDLTEYEIPRPDTVTADESVFGVKIQRLAGNRWIFLSAPTGQVWPHLQSFLAESQVDVVSSNAQTGLIETDWLQYSDEKEVMARFRISLEKGLHPESTEVHIREFQQALGGDPNLPTVWPVKSSDPEREEWLVKELANHLAETITNASASLLGQNVGGEVKAQFIANAPEPTLRLAVPRERAWATLIHSAKQDNFVTWDKDEARGIIYAGYDENQLKKRGFWRKLFFVGDGKLPESADHSVTELIQHLSGASAVRSRFDSIEGAAFADPLPKVESGFLILMTYKDDGLAEVVVRDHRGRRPPASEAKAMIRQLRKNLI